MTAPDQVHVSSDHESSQLSVASQGEKQEDWLSKISEVSERMTSQCGMVYDPTSGLYFDSQSGLYYDQVCVVCVVCVWCVQCVCGVCSVW